LNTDLTDTHRDLFAKITEEEMGENDVIDYFPEDSQIPLFLIPSLKLDKGCRNISFQGFLPAIRSLIDDKEEYETHKWDRILFKDCEVS